MVETILSLEELWKRSGIPTNRNNKEDSPISMLSAKPESQILYIASQTNETNLLEHFMQTIPFYFPTKDYSEEYTIILNSCVLGNEALPTKYFTELVDSKKLDYNVAFSLASNKSCPAGTLDKIFRIALDWSDAEKQVSTLRMIAHNLNTPSNVLQELVSDTNNINDQYVRMWADEQLTARGEEALTQSIH